MKILYVVPNVPSPIRVRPFNLIRELSREHDIFIICVATNESDRQFANSLQSCYHNVDIIPLSLLRSVWNCVTALFSSQSLRYAYFYSPTLARRVTELVAKGEVDLVHVEHLKSVPMVLQIVGKVPAVFDAVDCVSMFEVRRRKITHNIVGKVFSWLEWKKMLRWEAKATKLFDRIVISSPIDQEHYPATSSGKTVQVISNGVDLDYFRSQDFSPERNRIVFCGKLDYYPNQDAVLYFVRSVWPLIRARHSEVQFHIVGSRPARVVKDLNGKGNIWVHASVSDVRPFLGSAWVAVCPIRLQAGVQNKILEAMALGVPVVATRICCASLKVRAGKEILVADTPEEFASAVELLIENEPLRSGLVLAGREYVERYHRWDKFARELSDIYLDVVAEFSRVRHEVNTI